MLASKLLTAGGKMPLEVSLLLHGDGVDGESVFVDSSRYEQTVTSYGDVTTSSTTKKFGTASILFGSSGYLSVPHNDRFVFGAGDWCIDFWAINDGKVGNDVIFSKGGGADHYLFYFANEHAKFVLNGIQVDLNTSASPGFFQHYEISVTDGRLYAFQSGRKNYNEPVGGDVNGGEGDFILGRYNTTYNVGNRIDEFRVIKGSGYGHTDDFITPTDPY